MTNSRIEVLALAGDTCITLDQGEPIYNAVHERLTASDGVVVVDFSGVVVCASPFLNSAIGRLLKDFKPAELDQRLRVEKLTPTGLDLLRRVVENSKRYYNDPAARTALDSILNEEGDSSDDTSSDVSGKS